MSSLSFTLSADYNIAQTTIIPFANGTDIYVRRTTISPEEEAVYANIPGIGDVKLANLSDSNYTGTVDSNAVITGVQQYFNANNS